MKTDQITALSEWQWTALVAAFFRRRQTRVSAETKKWHKTQLHVHWNLTSSTGWQEMPVTSMFCGKQQLSPPKQRNENESFKGECAWTSGKSACFSVGGQIGSWEKNAWQSATAFDRANLLTNHNWKALNNFWASVGVNWSWSDHHKHKSVFLFCLIGLCHHIFCWQENGRCFGLTKKKLQCQLFQRLNFAHKIAKKILVSASTFLTLFVQHRLVILQKRIDLQAKCSVFVAKMHF